MRVFVFAMVALTTITSATELDGTQKDVRSLLRRATSVDIQSAGSVSDGQAGYDQNMIVYNGQRGGYDYAGRWYPNYAAALDAASAPAQYRTDGARQQELARTEQKRKDDQQRVDEERQRKEVVHQEEMRRKMAATVKDGLIILAGKLGSGAEGDVSTGHRASDPSDHLIAVKVARQGTLDDECEVMEAVAQSSNDNCRQHVIQMVGTCTSHAFQCGQYRDGMCVDLRDTNKRALGMELFDGSIEGFVNKNKDKAILCRETIMAQIRAGLDCLHQVGYVHMDLKHDNMFYKGLDEQGCPARAVVADLGMAQKIGTTIRRATFNDRHFSGSIQKDMALWAQDARPLLANSWLDDNGLALFDLCDLQGHCEPWDRQSRMRPLGVTVQYKVQEVGH